MTAEHTDQNPPDNTDKTDRLARIAPRENISARVDERYTRFVKLMKMALPLFAFTLTVIVFIWSSNDDQVVPEVEAPAAVKQTIGRNELIAPVFESLDNKEQPYTLTATRAIQAETNENLIILEEPSGELNLKSGATIAVRADQGAYRQDNQRLLLKNNVVITHSDGYELTTEQLDIDVEKDLIWTDLPVSGNGPAGTIDALGMRANMQSGILNFEGNAKLLLKDSKALGNAFDGQAQQKKVQK